MPEQPGNLLDVSLCLQKGNLKNTHLYGFRSLLQNWNPKEVHFATFFLSVNNTTWNHGQPYKRISLFFLIAAKKYFIDY